MTDRPEFDLRRAQESDYERLAAMYTAHLQVLASFNPEVDPTNQLQRDWLTQPDDLFAYLIDVGGVPVGFVLVTGKRYTEAIGEQGDFHLYEIFVEEAQRGSGAARFAVAQVLDRQRGSWSLMALIANGRAVGFWNRVLDREGLGLVKGDRDGRYITYAFDSSEGYAPAD